MAVDAAAPAVPAEVKQKPSEQILEHLKEQRAAVGEIATKLTKVEDRLSKLEVREGPPHARVVSVPGTGKDDPGKFSISRALLGMARSKDPKWEDVGSAYEKEVLDATRAEYLKKDASLANDTNLGFLVPSQVLSEQIIPLLRSKMILDKIGVNIMDGLIGSPVEIPRETGGGTFVWVGENTAITASDTAVDMVRLRPHKGAVLAKLSGTLFRAAGNRSIDAFVTRTIAETLRHGLQKAFFQGTGADAQPLGVLNSVGINTVASLAAIGTKDFDNVLSEIERDDADMGEMWWVMHPRVLNQARQLEFGSGDARRVFMDMQGMPSEKMRGVILGIPWATTTDMPINTAASPDEADILLGVWAESILGSWGSLELRASDVAGTSFEADQIWVRAIQEADVALRQPSAFCAGTGITGF